MRRLFGQRLRRASQTDGTVPARGMPVQLRLALAACALALLAAQPAAAGLLQARDYVMAGDATRVRIVLNLDRRPELRWFLLKEPHRLVVDLPETAFALEPEALKPRGLVTSVRYGKIGEDRSRMIFALDGPFEVENLSVMANEASPGYRMVADLVAAPEARFEAALLRQAAGKPPVARTSGSADDLAVRPADTPGKPFTIVIDPGHGGIDGGAEGVGGAVEKDITLAFGLELRDALEKTDKYRVVMTRSDDTFLRLDNRVRIARQAGADLFVSIHADTIGIKGIRGATVYTVSDRASDAAAAAVATRENLADELAGVEISDSNHEVADILIDLIRRETHSFSIRFARSLVGELSTTVEMINNPHRYAGFRVLRAPDVPSVLLELGYLSNPADEAELRDAKWRGKAIASMCRAIALFASARMNAGG